MNIVRKGEFLKSSNILIDFIGEDFKTSTNFSFANGSFHRNFDESSCFSLTQEIPITFPNRTPQELNIKAKILDKNDETKLIKFRIEKANY